jgi:hypothetical protein
MHHRLIRIAGGFLAGALMLLPMAGATTAFADGGPDRVPSVSSASGQRPGFGDHIIPPRPGFGDKIQPQAESAEVAPQSVDPTRGNAVGRSSTTTMVLVAGIVLAAGMSALVLAAVQRRHRLARA